MEDDSLPPDAALARKSVRRRIVQNSFFPPVAAAFVGLLGVWVCIEVKSATAMLLGLPVLIALLGAFFSALQGECTFSKVYLDAFVSQLLVGLGILLFNLNGLLCLIMAVPVSALLALPASALGRWLGRTIRRRSSRIIGLLLLPLFPGFVAFEYAHPQVAPLRKVITSVEIEAPRQRVWDVVIAFPTITAPPEQLLRWGIAYPISAHIEGSGPGAIRYCTFNTGSFVEPITRWEEPSLLAFDVSENPPPIREITLWEKFDPPHIHDRLASEKGEFRLIEHEGKTVLTGTTWYRHSLFPQFYWGPLSDYIIHRIHERVLWHIRDVAEQRPSL